MFIIAYAAYASIYIARLNFSVAASAFEAAGKLSRSQIGIIGSIFSFTYALSKVPNGYLGDRFSSRLIIVIGLLLAAISNLLIGFLPYFWSIAILRGINAYGQFILWGKGVPFTTIARQRHKPRSGDLLHFADFRLTDMDGCGLTVRQAQYRIGKENELIFGG